MSDTPELIPGSSQEPPLPHLVGHDRAIRISAGQHKVWLATLLGLFILGAGQLYNHQFVKGLLLLVLGASAMSLGNWALILWAIVAIGSVVDARMIARKLHQGKAVGEWECF